MMSCVSIFIECCKGKVFVWVLILCFSIQTFLGFIDFESDRLGS